MPEASAVMIKPSSNQNDLVAGSFCVRKGTLVLTPLNPPVNGGKIVANQGNGVEEGMGSSDGPK